MWLSLVLLLGCSNSPTPRPAGISCQPFGSTPAPISFSFAPGPVTSSAAEHTAVSLFDACQRESTGELTSSSVAGTGMRRGPNADEPVWLVTVDATVTEGSPGMNEPSHVLIEVNQATGVPTIVGSG
jgi:hypothetical protein